MIDARTWVRPTPQEVGNLVHSLRFGRSLEETCADIGARLGRSKRSVYYWMSDNPKPRRQIEMLEWLGLQELARGMYAAPEPPWHVFGPEELER